MENPGFLQQKTGKVGVVITDSNMESWEIDFMKQ